MRKTLGTVIGIAAIALMMNAPPVAAFHGSPYTALGTATFIPTGEIYNAKLIWSGVSGFGGTGTYQLELYEQNTGALFHKNSIPGRETFTNIFFYASNGYSVVEHVDYHGEFASPVPLVPSTGLLPNPVFKLDGWQENNLCNGKAIMHYWGHYLNLFNLDLIVWTY